MSVWTRPARTGAGRTGTPPPALVPVTTLPAMCGGRFSFFEDNRHTIPAGGLMLSLYPKGRGNWQVVFRCPVHTTWFVTVFNLPGRAA